MSQEKRKGNERERRERREREEREEREKRERREREEREKRDIGSIALNNMTLELYLTGSEFWEFLWTTLVPLLCSVSI